MVGDVRAYWNYGQYGLAVDHIHSMANNLRALVRSLEEQGELAMQDEDFASHVGLIHELIEEILNLKASREYEQLTTKQNIHITNQIIIALSGLINIVDRKFSRDIVSIKSGVVETPFSNQI